MTTDTPKGRARMLAEEIIRENDGDHISCKRDLDNCGLVVSIEQAISQAVNEALDEVADDAADFMYGCEENGIEIEGENVKRRILLFKAAYAKGGKGE